MNRVSAINEIRKDKSRAYFENLHTTEPLSFYSELLIEGDIDLAVAIITVRREKPVGYLIQTAAALDDVIKSDHNFRSYAFICNVDGDPLMHHDAQYLRRYLPYVDYNTESPGFKYFMKSGDLKNLTTSSINKRSKEYKDYITCLNLARYSANASFVLVVEDDSVPYADSFNVIKHMISQRLPQHNNGTLVKFAYLKLYYPEKWQGFAKERTSILDLVSFGSVFGSLLFALLYNCFQLHKHRRFYQTCAFAASILYCLILALMVGRQNINDLRRISGHFYRLQRAPACCTPAMLYQSDVIPQITGYLATKSASKQTNVIDLILHNFTLIAKMPAFSIEPSLFRHIGMHTSLSKSHKKPQYFLS